MISSPTDLLGALDSISDLLWVCTPEGRVTYVSQAWVEYTGATKASLLDFGWYERIHPEDQSRVKAVWAAAASSRTLECEFRLMRHDGAHRWFRARGNAVVDASGATNWVGTNADIHELREAREQISRANEDLIARDRERTLALEEAIAELTMAQSITHVGSWSFDLGRDEVKWSQELFRIVGREGPNAVPYDEQQYMFTPESWARLAQGVSECASIGTPYELELVVRRPSGELRTAMARGQAVRASDGTVQHLFGTFHDITELAEARREHDRSSERLTLATTAASMGVWDWDIKGERLVWDSRMFELYHLSSSTTASFEAWQAALHPDDRAPTLFALKQAIGGVGLFDTTFRILTSNGVKHLRAAATVFRDAAGAAIRMVGVNWDVTRERETELALLANKALLDEFVRHAPAAIAMFDLQMRYLQTSDQWARDYKLTGQEVIGRSHYEVFPEIPDRWKAIHQRVLAGAIEGCAEDPFPRADGRMDWLQWEARPWHEVDGRIGGLIFFTQVVTARKEMELLLETQKADLERSNRDLEQFASAASHDLQEPLRAVSGCAQILESQYRGQLDSSADTLIGHIVDGATRMRTLITDLLLFSRVATHGDALRPIDSTEAFHRAMYNLSTSIGETSAVVEIKGTLPIVRGDPSQLAQVFQNLIGNALKYRNATTPPRIEISAQRSEGQWVFAVRDNGIGIEPAYFEKIFALFQRLHTRTEYPGTGIGLALCKRIIERHHGRIWVESTLGEGATFFFTLQAEPGGASK